MMMVLARKFEGLQDSFPISFITDSGFSGEDLVSDLLGFYRVVSIQNPFEMLRPVSKEKALKRWDYYGKIGSWKNRGFTPLLFPDPERFPNASPRKGLLPNFMQTVRPWNDFHSGIVSIASADGSYIDKAKGGNYLMRKSVKVLSGIIIVVAAALACTWPYMKMEFAGNTHYTEQNKREYQFYTPNILKNIPRISPQYDFDFANITGPASHVYAIRFYDTNDASRVDAYLNSMGYKKQETCHIEAACWRTNDPQEVITVSTLENPEAILVSVIYTF